jgi:hypothetical protein
MASVKAARIAKESMTPENIAASLAAEQAYYASVAEASAVRNAHTEAQRKALP